MKPLFLSLCVTILFVPATAFAAPAPHPKPIVAKPTAAQVHQAATYDAAVKAYKAGNAADAIAKLHAYLSATPNDAVMLGLLGYLELQQGTNLPQATTDLRTAAKLDPTNIVNRSNFATALIQQRLFVEALPELEFVAKKEPDDIAAQGRLAGALAESGEYKKALVIYQRVVKMPNCPAPVFKNEALTLARLQMFATAGQAYEHAAKMIPTDVGAWTGAGICYSHGGKPADAVRCLAQAIKLGPTDPYNTRFLYGTALAETGHASEALKQFKYLTVMKPDSFAVWYNLGLVNEKLGNKTDAIAAYRQALQLNPDHEQTLLNLTQLLIETGQTSDAVNQLAGASKEHPEVAALHIALGMAYQASGQDAQAIPEYKSALTINTKDDLTRVRLADLYTSAQQWPEALTEYQILVKDYPENAALQSQLGATYEEMNRFPEALAALTKSVEINPKSAIAWNNLGAVHERLGDKSAAIADYKKAVALAPALDEPRKNLARLTDAQAPPMAAPKAPEIAPATKPLVPKVTP